MDVEGHVVTEKLSHCCHKLVPSRPMTRRGGEARGDAVASLPAGVDELRRSFLEMTRRAADSDLCIAYLPGAAPSMGTAMEMYQAHLASVPVVTVTAMVTNLAIVSTSSYLVRDLDALEEPLVDVRDGRVHLSPAS